MAGGSDVTGTSGVSVGVAGGVVTGVVTVVVGSSPDGVILGTTGCTGVSTGDKGVVSASSGTMVSAVDTDVLSQAARTVSAITQRPAVPALEDLIMCVLDGLVFMALIVCGGLDCVNAHTIASPQPEQKFAIC